MESRFLPTARIREPPDPGLEIVSWSFGIIKQFKHLITDTDSHGLGAVSLLGVGRVNIIHARDCRHAGGGVPKSGDLRPARLQKKREVT